MKRLLLCFLGIILVWGLAFAKDKPERIAGSRFMVSLKAKQSEEKRKGFGISIFGINIIKKSSPEEWFEVKINYTNYYFITDEGLPGYYIGLPMSNEVEITNKSGKDFKNLNVTMVHEYYESGVCNRYWSPPNPVEFLKGEQLPGDSAIVWPGIDIAKDETVVLTFEYVPPYATSAGLDQTHVIIENRSDDGDDTVIIELYNESESGVFCPPPPE